MAPLICWSFSNSMFRYLLVDHANRNKCSDIWEPAKAIWCWCWLRPRRPLHPSGTAQAVASALVDISQTILQHAVERITAAGLASKVATRREDLTQLSFPDGEFRYSSLGACSSISRVPGRPSTNWRALRLREAPSRSTSRITTTSVAWKRAVSV